MNSHHPVFSYFEPFSGPPEPGYEIDFLGCRIRHELWPSSMRSGVPQTTYPPFDEEYFEWIDLLESVVSAQGSYTMIELGAGFGRWAVRAAQATQKQSGLPVRLVAVEAEPTHYGWIPVHFLDNGIDPNRHTLIHAAVSDVADPVLFYVGMPGEAPCAPSEWYGQAIVKPYEEIAERNVRDYESRNVVMHVSGWKSVEVPTISLSEVLRRVEFADLMDLDIQGEEGKAIGSAIKETTAKVKRLHVATHSHEIEQDLRRLLPEFGWKCTADYPCESVNPTPWGTLKFTDGVQTWTNPALVP